MKSLNIVVVIIAAVITGGLVHYYWPRIETKTVVQTVTKNHTITRIIKQPNGTTITEIDSTTSSSKNKQALKVAQARYHLGAAIMQNYDPLIRPSYQFDVGMRILGPIWIDALLSTNKQVGLQLSIEF